ncbi:MAG: tetratricopeptide (TPR) repeat protein [Flavobacterium sp.]|jgi:tetratricopeptide (TPR) repeat protein
MKKLVYILVLFSTVLFAQNSNNAIKNGNQLYQQGKYEEAIAQYNLVLNNEEQAAELYFNLGNSHYQLHQISPAIYNYEKALLLKPKDSVIANNLEFARKLLVDDIKEYPKVGFDKIIKNATSLASFDTWAIISVVLAFTFFLLFLGYYFSAKAIIKRTFFTGMFVAFIAIIFSISAAFFEKNYFESNTTAIIFAEKTILRKEGNPNSKSIMELHEGTKVYILQSQTNWKKVQLTDETIGWLQSDAVKELK